MRRIRLFSLLFLLAFLGACVRFSNQYAPDRARDVDVSGDPRGLDAYLSMKNGRALKHFAGGVDPAAFDGEQRKVGPQAAFRFAPAADGAWNFKISYHSGAPQSVSIRVNAMPLGSFEANGSGEWIAPLPPATLVSGVAALVEVNSTQGLGVKELGFLRP